MCKVLINKDIAALGVDNDDINHMLKALNIEFNGTYAPTYLDVIKLVQRAREAELKKNRRVQKWESVMAKLK